MYKLMSGSDVVVTSASEIIYNTKQKAWMTPKGWVSDSAKSLVVKNTSVAPIEFKMLFTATERVAINTLRATDPAVDDFFLLLDDQRLNEVTLDIPTTIEGVTYTINEVKATLSYDQPTADARIAAILAGGA